jgi:hypothetical protein
MPSKLKSPVERQAIEFRVELSITASLPSHYPSADFRCARRWRRDCFDKEIMGGFWRACEDGTTKPDALRFVRFGGTVVRLELDVVLKSLIDLSGESSSTTIGSLLW